MHNSHLHQTDFRDKNHDYELLDMCRKNLSIAVINVYFNEKLMCLLLV